MVGMDAAACPRCNSSMMRLSPDALPRTPLEVRCRCGYKSIWASCITCRRLFEINTWKAAHQKTFSCSRKCMAAHYRTLNGSKSAAWRGGAGTVNSLGYVVVNRGGKVLLMHRLIMEEHLGRKLGRGEVVHHINGSRSDNRIENLVVCGSQGEHVALNHVTPKRLPKRCLFCDKAPLARGLCNAHYKRAKRHGLLNHMPTY